MARTIFQPQIMLSSSNRRGRAIISGEQNGKDAYADNDGIFTLDLESMRWRKSP